MFPGIYGFSWSTGYLIFLSVFYTVVLVILTTLSIALWRAWRAFKKDQYETLLWEADFEDLPQSARCCRHELTGEYRHRICQRAFDCRGCEEHARLMAARAAEEHEVLDEERSSAGIYGLDFPLDRIYHRGHTWVKPKTDGTVTVGLDAFAAHLIGKPDQVDLPRVGRKLKVNGPGWKVRKGNQVIRILSPVEGEVVATGRADQGWYLKLRLSEKGCDLRHLLCPEEIQPWMLRELERLQFSLAPEGVRLSLADGGELMEDLPKHYPQADWDMVYGNVFLQP